jgi:uncharacterized protein (TIGR02996 family)
VSDDLRALLAAVVADPADDTARLVYADCLEERGNLPRARFIRLQIEAERLHPDSNARARLEEEAEALFAEHWIDWWAEVCAAVGFPIPVRNPKGPLGRLARRVGIVNPSDYPFTPKGLELGLRSGRSYDARLAGWTRAAFRRGFPDGVDVMLPLATPRGNFLTQWPAAAPLAALFVHAPYTEAWIDGPHLAGLKSLTLDDYDPVVLLGALNSPHLARLEDLTLRVPWYGNEFAMFADELARVVVSPRIRQLKRLDIPVWSDRAAEVVAAAANLAGLESLAVELEPPDPDILAVDPYPAGSGRRLAILARSPHLAGLRELRAVGSIDSDGVETAVRNPIWSGLRKLDLDTRAWPADLEVLTGPVDLLELEDLRLSGISYSVAQVAALGRSPLLKRLRHFAVRGGPPLSADEDIADAVDPDRIETFAIGASETPPRVAGLLRKQFGDRFRILT